MKKFKIITSSTRLTDLDLEEYDDQESSLDLKAEQRHYQEYRHAQTGA